ncbi:MAG: phosphohistidine phosphatase SixA [Gemmatimonadaceae bacterium]|nr:phosphohistidine phosphatase SixA [Gemmatimonadaceae bacterium]
MFLLVIRHAIAEERDAFARSGASDDERPLTALGKRRMRRNAAGLRRVAPHLDVLATSPLVRAQQTARLVAEAYGKSAIETVEALRPEAAPRALFAWLARQPSDAIVAVVGHEPHVGRLMSWSLAGVDDSAVVFKKGGVALVEFAIKPAARKGRLHWLLTPAQLRALAK